jgi:FAD/FMN-containing dehydrogenase
MTDVIERLAGVVGRPNVLTDTESQAPFLVDWPSKHRGAARAVVRPASTEEVAGTLAICTALNIPVVPQGGNTSLSGGATPDDSGRAIVLSLGRMNRIRAVDPIGLTMVVDAGAVLAHVQNAAHEAGCFFPLSLGSEGSCTIGGNLAANAGGVAVLRYGVMRELTLGLEVALPDGRIWNGLKALRKDNSGYALKDLFIGSEGTLGIITGAVLKLFPQTPARATAFAAVADAGAALKLLVSMRAHCGDRLTAFEFMTDKTLALVNRHICGTRLPFTEAYNAVVLVELSDTDQPEFLTRRLEGALAEATDNGIILDAVIAQDIAQVKSFWRLREGISEALVKEGRAAKHDISVPVALMPDFVAAAEAAVLRAMPGVRPIVFGHLGDGNLHYNLLRPVDINEAEFAVLAPRLTEIVHDETDRFGGSISAEHGIGQLRVTELSRRKTPLELEMMAALKAVFDPMGLLNPGKLLSASPSTKA